ncbi:MAG: hypothetical protein LBT35_02685 [Tannerella sp.]|nr:hypothetical protein [Tannerella sp.]
MSIHLSMMMLTMSLFCGSASPKDIVHDTISSRDDIVHDTISPQDDIVQDTISRTRADDARLLELDEVVVTGTRTPKSLPSRSCTTTSTVRACVGFTEMPI